MNTLLSRRRKRTITNSSDIKVYHNLQFPLNDIIDVLYPLFAPFYPYDEFLKMVTTVNHIFVAYDQRQGQSVACALVNNTGTNGGLYILLFGVRQSYQSHGTGTHLLKKIIRWAYEAGRTYIYLHVHVENHKAIGLYEKVGFRKQEYLPNYYSPAPKQPPHAFRMVLSF